MNAPSAAKKTRAKQAKTPLPATDREQLMSAITRHGFPAVVSQLREFDPYRESNSAGALLRNVTRDQAYSFNSSSLNLLRDLAGHYRSERLAAIAASVPAPPPVAVPPPAPLAPPPSPAPGVPEMSPQAISAIVVSVMQALGGHRPWQPEQRVSVQLPEAPTPAPPLPTAAVAAFVALVPGRDQIKLFAELDDTAQLNILHAMHSRYGDTLRDQGIPSGEHRAAWRISYDAYDNETGKGCQDRATAEGKATGSHVKPVEVIRRDGDLVRFYEIVRKVWQR